MKDGGSLIRDVDDSSRYERHRHGKDILLKKQYPNGGTSEKFQNQSWISQTNMIKLQSIYQSVEPECNL